MKNVVWIVVGLAIAGLAWVPLNLSDPRDIPFIPAVLGMVGTLIGGVIALLNFVQWARRASARQ